MKNIDFKGLLNLRPSESVLRNHNYTVNFPIDKFDANYDLIGLHKFIEEKHQKWEQIPEIPEFSSSRNFFKNVLNVIENAVAESSTAESTRHQNILNALSKSTRNIFLPDSPNTLFLLDLNSNYPESLGGAVAGIINSIDFNRFGNSNYFKGIFLATGFITVHYDRLSSDEAVSKSLIQLRNEFQQEKIQILSDFENLVINTNSKASSEISNLQGALESWNSEYGQQLGDLKATADVQMNKSDSAGRELLKKSLRRKIHLEQTYREQMRFKAPAEYWKERAVFLNNEGRRFLNWLIALVVLGVVILYSLLWLTPQDMLENIFSGNASKAIRWSIIFITLISLLFVGIQALKKAMFSSYHLARDAEEREKLTVFYLSLIKDSTITQEDRSLVLQALFSRADTGMLKDESSPTMPGILDKIKN